MRKINLSGILIIAGICCLGLLQSCKVFYPSTMLKTKRDYPFDQTARITDTLYKIGVNDEISLELYANEGIRMIDIFNSGTETQKSDSKPITYYVEHDGTVRFPIIGRISLEGKTIRQAEDTIQTLFSRVYTNPFARLSVENRRVIVYPGNGGKASVIPLVQPNVTLMEALAEAGGINETGKAYKVKLVRGDYDNPQVYLINLRRIEGLKDADIILQPNDIIYVEERNRGTIFMREVFPWLTSISSLLGVGLTVYTLTKIK